ncbi:MAG: bacteriohemerythrin [bacterium]|nr:bacteriohemerythrin [bacterium]
MKWDESLAVGIGTIDQQHQKLFGLIAQLQTAMGQGESKAVLQDIFKGLLEYTEDHFSHEAEIFAQIGYERAEDHLAKHESFTRKLHELKSQFDSSSNFMIGVDVMTFMTDWLVSHILGEDQKYIPLFKEHNIR